MVFLFKIFRNIFFFFRLRIFFKDKTLNSKWDSYLSAGDEDAKEVRPFLL
jgi:hypothetical protein